MGYKALPENTAKPSLSVLSWALAQALASPPSNFHASVPSERASLQTKQYPAHWREIKRFISPLQTEGHCQEDEALAMFPPPSASSGEQ